VLALPAGRSGPRSTATVAGKAHERRHRIELRQRRGMFSMVRLIAPRKPLLYSGVSRDILQVPY
jgi:hypothetical protein